MDALILAGGFSTRLYPLTEYFPKALLPIAGKPIVSYLIDELVAIRKIRNIYFITNARYRPVFSSWLRVADSKERITLIDDGARSPDERLGAIGDIVFAMHRQRINTDLLVLASDTYSSLKLADFIAFFGTHRGVVNAVFDTHDRKVITGRLGCVTIEGPVMSSFVEKPKHPASSMTSIPYYIYPQETLPLIETYFKEGGPTDGSGSIIPWLLTKTRVFAYDIGNGFYFDVGTTETYNMLSGRGIPS